MQYVYLFQDHDGYNVHATLSRDGARKLVKEANFGFNKEYIEKAESTLKTLFEKTDEQLYEDGGPYTLIQEWPYKVGGALQLHIIPLE